MKTRLFIAAFGLSILLVLPQQIFAQEQLTKADLKKLKKQKKAMSLPEFKTKVEQYQAAVGEKAKAQRQNKNLGKTISGKEEEIEKLKEELAGLKKNSKPKTAKSYTDDYSQGVLFRVQIGAYKTKFYDLSKYTNHRRFHIEEVETGANKYTIGTFRDYWEADLFKKYLQEMGVGDAWVVAYQNNKRVDITEVLGEEDIEAVKAGEDLNKIDNK
jgi:predicted RNase H-like nuclease (RuvC/YqgF family)